MTFNLAAFGVALHAVRTGRNATLRDVADACQLSPSTIQRIESGQHQSAHLVSIATLASWAGMSLDPFCDWLPAR